FSSYQLGGLITRKTRPRRVIMRMRIAVVAAFVGSLVLDPVVANAGHGGGGHVGGGGHFGGGHMGGAHFGGGHMGGARFGGGHMGGARFAGGGWHGGGRHVAWNGGHSA